jgi:hypothetical protein
MVTWSDVLYIFLFPQGWGGGRGILSLAELKLCYGTISTWILFPGIWWCVIWWMRTHISEECTASIFRVKVNEPFLWNVGKLLPEHELRISENRLLGRIFRPKRREEETGERWRVRSFMICYDDRIKEDDSLGNVSHMGEEIHTKFW